MSGSNCCLICFNPVPVNQWLESDLKERRNLCRRFCIIMCRYLKINVGESESLIRPEKTMSIGADYNYNAVCCDLCHTSVKSICHIYRNWNCFQLRLNRSVKLIAKMMAAGNCKSSSNPKLKSNTSESIVNFQKRFLNRVIENPKSSVDYPHLTLEQIKLQPQPALKNIKIEPVKSEPFLNDVNNEDLHIFVTETKPYLAPESPDWRPESDSPEDFIEENPQSLKLPKKRGRKKKLQTKLKITDEKKKKISSEELSRNCDKYRCTECPKTFILPRSLQYHIRMTHKNLPETEKRPFSCIVCGEGMRFATRKNLASHEQNIHKNELSFKCGVCEMTFGNRKVCRDHQNEAHGIILRGPIEVTVLDTKQRVSPNLFAKFAKKFAKTGRL